MDDQFIEAGRILKPHGIKGELKVSFESPFDELVNALGYVHVPLGGHLIPFFVETFRSNFTLLKLEDVNTPEEAASISHQPAYLLKKDVPGDLHNVPFEETEENPYHELQGYTIRDKNRGEIGQISEMMELPMQIMAVVHHHDKEFLIPLNDTFIQSIDKTNKIIHMQLPNGILDL